jgi:hypothetical protein
VQAVNTHRDAFTEFIGVYNANSTLWGEVSYWIGARFGVRHCSLCDITHGLFSQRPEWQECASALEIPFIAFHINDAPAEVTQAANGNYPVVLGKNSVGIHIVLTADDLEQCDGSPERLLSKLQSL